MGKLLIFSISCAVIIIVSLTVYFLTKKPNSTVTTTPNIQETTTTNIPNTTSNASTITTTNIPNTTSNASTITTTTPISTTTENPNLLSIQYNQKNDYSINADVATTSSFTIGKVGINGTFKNISFFSTVNSTSFQSGSLPTYRLQIVSSDGSRIIFDSNIKIITWAVGSTFINMQMDSNVRVNFNDNIVLILNGKNFNLTNSVTVIKVIPDNSQITKKLITSGSYCTTCTESNNLNTNTYNLGQPGISGFLTDLTIIINQSTFVTDNSPKTITITVNSYTYTTELRKNNPQDVLYLSNFPNVPINSNDNFTLTLNGYDVKLTNTDISFKMYPNEAYIITTPVGGNTLKINFSNGSSQSSVNLISQAPKGFPGMYFISFNNFSCRDDNNTPIPFDYNIAFIPSSIQIEINNLNYSIEIMYFGGVNITKCTDTIKLLIPPSAYSNIFGYITSNSTTLLPSQATGMIISLS